MREETSLPLVTSIRVSPSENSSSRLVSVSPKLQHIFLFKGIIVKDYFSNHKRGDIVVTENYESIHPLLGGTNKPLLYRGTGLQLVNYENCQLYNLFKAEPTTFAKNEIKNEVARVGSEISLIAGVQGLNNARALISGGLDFFSVTNLSMDLLLATSRLSRISPNRLLRKTAKSEWITWNTSEKVLKVNKHFSKLEKSCISKLKLKNWIKEPNRGSHTSKRTFKWSSWCWIHGWEFLWPWVTPRKENTRLNSGYFYD